LLLLDLLAIFTLGFLFLNKAFVLTIVIIRSLFLESLPLLLLLKDIKIALSALIWRLSCDKNLYLKELKNFALFELNIKMLFLNIVFKHKNSCF
jgi:hypothetical protein